jgi:hypothetical protein
MKIETLVQVLNEGEVEVKFLKANGDIRVLHGTRNLDLIPIEDHPSGTGRVQSEDIVTVYDLDAYGWRSFRKDAIISCTVTFN